MATALCSMPACIGARENSAPTFLLGDYLAVNAEVVGRSDSADCWATGEAATTGYNCGIVPLQEFQPMTTPSEAVEIYCVKCKAKTASRDVEAVTMKNGRAATRSICAECGTKKFRIGVLP